MFTCAELIQFRARVPADFPHSQPHMADLTQRGTLRNPADPLETFADTAGLIARLDLVISVDTSVAHLAGALGKPVWVLLPWLPDWHWQLGRSDSPWYPSARLFRQTESDDWKSVIATLRQELDALRKV